MKKIFVSLFTIFAVVAATSGATQAVFSDTETSTGNTFAAGTLDLNIDDDNENVVKFTVNNMRPGNQPKGAYTLANVGSLNGYLDLSNVAVTSNENDCGDPEVDAGDNTCGNPGTGEGELADVVNMHLFIDRDGDGWIGGGDSVFYNGKVANVPSSFDLNEQINGGASTKIVALFDWWNTADDNKAQSDSMEIDFTFELNQNQ